MATPLPSGVSHCVLHDRMFPAAMECPSCALSGGEEECTASAQPVDILDDAIELAESKLGGLELLFEREMAQDAYRVLAQCPQCGGRGICSWLTGAALDGVFSVDALAESLARAARVVRAGCLDGSCAGGPLDYIVDGLTIRECLDIYQVRQRDGHCVYTTLNGRPTRLAFAGHDLTPAQIEAARAAWSAQLRAKVEASKEKGVEVVVDDDRWEL